jgi:hypothetical protein
VHETFANMRAGNRRTATEAEHACVAPASMRATADTTRIAVKRRSSSRPTSRPVNASRSRRHSKPYLPSLERTFKSASLNRVALRSGIQGRRQRGRSNCPLDQHGREARNLRCLQRFPPPAINKARADIRAPRNVRHDRAWLRDFRQNPRTLLVAAAAATLVPRDQCYPTHACAASLALKADLAAQHRPRSHLHKAAAPGGIQPITLRRGTSRRRDPPSQASRT